MKNYILFLIIGLLVVNTSCDSWLEETQFDKINSSTLYESEEGLEIGLNGLYGLSRRFSVLMIRMHAELTGFIVLPTWLWCVRGMKRKCIVPICVQMLCRLRCGTVPIR